MTAFLMVLAVAAEAYLLGSVDTGILVSKYLYHDDVRTHGSGAAGMTNMLRTFGKKAAALTAVGDVLKGVVAVCLGRWLFSHLPADAAISPYLGVYLAAILAVVGHSKPIYFGFKGGKGILCSGTLLLLLDWRIALVGWGAFVVLWLTTRYVSLGSVSAAAVFPVMTHVVFGDAFATAFSVLIAALVLFAHRENIKRLLNGTENKFRFHVNAPKSEGEA